jgi:hypothetical protein
MKEKESFVYFINKHKKVKINGEEHILFMSPTVNIAEKEKSPYLGHGFCAMNSKTNKETPEIFINITDIINQPHKKTLKNIIKELENKIKEYKKIYGEV